MKKIIVVLVVLLSISSIIAGKLHWDSKIKEAASTLTKSEVLPTKVEIVMDENKENEDNLRERIELLSKNVPVEVKSKLFTAAENKEALNFVIAGSSATPEKPAAWPSLLKSEFENTYGKEILNVTIKEMADKTSTEIVVEGLYQDIINLAPDILLLEPFILHDNGKLIPINTRLENITTMINAIKKENPDVVIILQPPNPLYNAVHYPKEVERLKGYAKENKYIYLDHWVAWPDPQSVKITDYLISGSPNQKGHELWAGYLINYFTDK